MYRKHNGISLSHPNTKGLRRFFSRVTVNRVSGCWEWTGTNPGTGYGFFSWNYFSTSAHRTAYKWFVDSRVEGLVVDHLCRNRACVNPAHMEAVTQEVNMQRALLGTTRPTCKVGHPMVVGNIFLQRNYGKVFRTCAICHRRREDTRRAKRRAPVTTITVRRTA